MPVYQMRAPNGRTYRVTGPAGATDEQVRAEILRQFPEAAGAPKVKPKPKKKSFWEKTKEYGEAALTGVAEGMRPVAEFAERLNPIDALGDIIEEKIAPGRQAKVKKQKAQQAARMAQRNPNVFTGGKIVGEIAATAPLIALGGTAVSAMGAAPRVVAAAPRAAKAVQRLGQAIVSGGIGTGRTAAQTAAMTTGQRALQAGERVVGGAISGATGAALTDQDVTTGAIFGAGLPVMATVLKRVGGKTIDLFRMPKVKAAQIIREVLGDNVEETRRVLAQLSPDDQRLAQQVLIEAGVEPRAFFGLGDVVTKQFDPDTTARVLAQQTAAREARMAGITGGANATERRRAIDLGRQAVSATTTPLREAAFAARGPIDAAPIVDALRAQAGAEGVKTSSARNALLSLAKRVEAGADDQGFISPESLYTLRKEASDIIEKYVASAAQPSSGSKKQAASLVMDFRSLVDDAFGPEFKDYLTRHREGMAAIDRQELAAEAANLMETNPNQFIRLMAGGKPKNVEDVMGRGTRQYDITDLATTDPQRFNALVQTAKELNIANRMDRLAVEGTGKASRIMREQRPGMMERGVGMLLRTKFPSLAFATIGAENVQTAAVAPRVLERLAGGYASGNAMRNVMEQYPTAMNVSQAISGMRPITRNVMAQAPARVMQQFPAVDPDTGETLIEIGYNEDGTAYPIYGRTTAR